MLRAYHELLRPGGKMVMELSDLERSRHRLKTDVGVVERETNGVTRNARRRLLDRACCTSATSMATTWSTRASACTRPSDLERMAVEAGFREVERYGDFAGGPKRPEDRLVLVATA